MLRYTKNRAINIERDSHQLKHTTHCHAEFRCDTHTMARKTRVTATAIDQPLLPDSATGVSDKEEGNNEITEHEGIGMTVISALH